MHLKTIKIRRQEDRACFLGRIVRYIQFKQQQKKVKIITMTLDLLFIHTASEIPRRASPCYDCQQQWWEQQKKHAFGHRDRSISLPAEVGEQKVGSPSAQTCLKSTEPGPVLPLLPHCQCARKQVDLTSSVNPQTMITENFLNWEKEASD